MAGRPILQVNNLPAQTDDTSSHQSPPARGREMRQNLLQKLRAPPLVHLWEFWHERQDRSKTANTKPPPTGSISPSAKPASPGVTPEQVDYEERLINMCTITDVREFWELFNNFDVSKLPLRDSVHLFHKGIRPLWEDARNVKGGSWTFRVPKEKAKEFWKEVCMMAIGEHLQEAVTSKRISQF